MAVRRVEIRLTSTGFDELVRKVDDLSAKLDKLSRGTYNVRVRLDDGGAGARLDDMAMKLDKISRARITPKIDIQGLTRSAGELDRLNLELDKLAHKRVTTTVRVNVDRRAMTHDISSALRDAMKLFPGGGGGGGFGKLIDTGNAGVSGGGGAAGGLLSMIGGANNQYLGGLIALLAGAAATVTPALVPFGLGLGVGGGGAAGALAVGNTERQKLIQLANSLAGAKGPQRRNIQAQINAIQKQYGPEIQIAGQFSGLGKELLAPLSMHDRGGGSFLQGLSGILQEVGKFLKAIGPDLGKALRASLPILQAALTVFEKFAKAALPAITTSLNQLVRTGSLKILTQAFVILAQGVADFINRLGPGMRDSAIIFKAMSIFVKDALIAIGNSANWLAHLFVNMVEGAKIAAHDIHHWWDVLRHDTATEFDDIRHNVASVWDSIWSNTMGRFERGVKDAERLGGDLRHGIANTFDSIRHDVASIWDTLWNDTIGRAARADDAILSKERAWGHDIAHYFDTIRHDVASTWDSMWSDVKSSVHSALNWIGTQLNRVEGFFAKPFEWVSQHVLHPLGSIWDNIVKVVHLGLPHFPAIPAFAGGGWVPGPASPGRDNTIAAVASGERVLSHREIASVGGPSMVDAIFGRGQSSGPGYSIGGWIGHAFSWLGNKALNALEGGLGGVLGVIPGAKTLLGDIAKGAGDAGASLLVRLIDSTLGSGGWSGAVGGIASDLVKHVIPALAHKTLQKAQVTMGATTLPANLFNVGKYMYEHGFSRAAAAGIASCVAGESGGDPDAAGSGGRGLIGWTPPGKLPNYAFTGNRQKDFDNQLPLIVKYAKGWGQYIPLLNSQTNPVRAADIFSQFFERPAVTNSDVRASVANSVFARLGGVKHMAAGGWINEPIMGTGLHSGTPYTFGEREPEYVMPAGERWGHHGGDTYIFQIAGDTDPDAAARRIWLKLRDLKRHRGGQSLGL